MIRPDQKTVVRLVILLLVATALAGCTSQSASPSAGAPRHLSPPGSGPQANIRIESVPPGADIYINTTWYAITNVTIELPEGYYTYSLVNRGYQKYPGNFTANVSSPDIIRAVLVPVPETPRAIPRAATTPAPLDGGIAILSILTALLVTGVRLHHRHDANGTGRGK